MNTTPSPMRCAEALATAIAELESLANTTAIISRQKRLQRAVVTLQAMFEQRGMEVFENGDDGWLPNFCDVVIFG